MVGWKLKDSGVVGQELAPFLLPRWWRDNITWCARAGTESVAASILCVCLGLREGGNGEPGESMLWWLVPVFRFLAVCYFERI